MRTAYKAPIDPKDDVDAIVDYLAGMKIAK